MHPIVECVPNFSEGRRPEVVAQIVEAIRSVADVRVLDVESDADHNRSVITFIGPPHAVEEAAFRAAARAAQLIDMEQHRGEHPRMGATDVIPFVPAREVTMADCVAMARRVGRRLGEELGIPVYLYEEAATRETRRNLADVRRGEYEGIKAEIATNPEREPDFGPRQLGPAGATAVGARPFLIAYNVNLATTNLEVARAIAKAVRHSSGGLRYVKALGLGIKERGIVQVSMNMTNYEGTPLHRAFEMVKREAARYGVNVASSEIVGLAPQAALLQAAEFCLQLENFQPAQILENRLAESPQDQPAAQMAGFLDAVAAGTPTPGGGSVAALAGALGAALEMMVANLTLGRKKYAAVEADMESIRARAQALRSELAGLVARDSAAYEQVMAAYRLPKDAPEREGTIQAALLGAAEVPLTVAEKALEVIELAAITASKGNPNATSDAVVGAYMARAAVDGAALNVRTNLTRMTDASRAHELRRRVDEIQSRAQGVVTSIESRLNF